MQLSEYFKFRNELIEQSKEEDGGITQSSFIATVLPELLTTRLIESEDIENIFFEDKEKNIKINGYSLNESRDRLQIYIVNEPAMSPLANEKELSISLKSYYEELFISSKNFVKFSFLGYLKDDIMDAHPINYLTHYMSSSEAVNEIDVVEIFLITPTLSLETRGAIPYPKRFVFDNEEIKLTVNRNGQSEKKAIIIEKKIIDLNYLFDVSISKGSEYDLIVDFEKDLGGKIEVLKAANEENFETYLCVIPATAIASLYKNAGGTRILEKNVRSFLQFGKKSVNSGMKSTILKAPEKFIAFNNGLTITATDKIIEEINGRLYLKSLTNFQIVNGGQTTATIFFSNKEGLNIDKINLMAKINVAKNISESDLETLIDEISYFSNRQTKVSGVDNNKIKPQLDKIKSLSNSVVTPSGSKWFFERLKGQFGTMIRMAGGNKARIEREYPKDRRFTKEILGKYYTSWGEKPYLVKLGGDKVFGYFSEELVGDGDKKKPQIIDRKFYEELIAKMILVKSLEKIYGQGKNSIGQLRAAVIPYSISVLYLFTNGSKTSPDFDLGKIWLKESLEKDLADFFKNLMTLVNTLLKDKRYNNSDDTSDNTKKPEVWTNISSCDEIIEFMNSDESRKIISKFGIKKGSNSKSIESVDFEIISDTVAIASKGPDYYKKITELYRDHLSDLELRKIDRYRNLLKSHSDIGFEGVKFFNSLNTKIMQNMPEIFDKVIFTENLKLHITLSKIISVYNNAILAKKDIQKDFEALEQIAIAKKIKYSSIISQIGKELSNGKAPSLKSINLASNYFYNSEKNYLEVNNTQPVLINEDLLQQLLKWDATNKSLTPKEISYITDFAFGLKPLTDFDKVNLERHFRIVEKSGFTYDSDLIRSNIVLIGDEKKKNEKSSNLLNISFYLKKIVNQDLERTPTFSVEAIRDFFQIELNHGESKVINIQNALSGNIFKVEFKLRETRNEYRVFLNDLFKEIAPNEKEILIFSKVDDGNYLCEHISLISSRYKELNSEFDLNKNHKLI